MKQLVISLVFLPFTVFAQQIKWLTFSQAQSLQEANPKKILVDVYTDWCSPCKLLDEQTFANKDVARYVTENFYPVKFNAEGNEQINYFGQLFLNPQFKPKRRGGRNATHSFAKFLNVNAYPCLVFIDESGELITSLLGFMTPLQIELYLKLIANNEFTTIKTREDFLEYQEKFENTFKIN